MAALASGMSSFFLALDAEAELKLTQLLENGSHRVNFWDRKAQNGSFWSYQMSLYFIIVHLSFAYILRSHEVSRTELVVALFDHVLR